MTYKCFLISSYAYLHMLNLNAPDFEVQLPFHPRVGEEVFRSQFGRNIEVFRIHYIMYKEGQALLIGSIDHWS